MSQSDAGDKSEKPTPHKLRKAREEGQVARSRDVGTAVGVLACLQLALWLMPGWLDDFRRLFALAMPGPGPGGLDDAASQLFPATLMLLAKMLLPLAAVPACIALASLFPGGWVLAPAQLQPRFSRLNPAANLGKLVKPRHYAQTGMLVLKCVAVLAVLYWQCRGNLRAFAALQGVPLEDALAGGSRLLLDTMLWLCAVLAAFALADVPLQGLLFLREQRMSKRDLKEEHKQNEGRPEVKQRMRQLRRAMLHSGIRRAVPQADVVVVNPTHYAVALKYDESRAQAPFVLAKGLDESALFIRQVAEAHGVEVLELPPLARAVYHTSQVNQQIPAALYDAVAQVLIYVLQIKAFRNGQRRAPPRRPARLDIPAELSSPEPA
ncbi:MULTISPECIES: EscU/YscU/HrcU family type III secretion system export apparatus switch protein [Pseudoxanthomonas]|uniref:Flagellar biosynthetic protein FlhB n=1 Tax=Pseudoxanthomonas taiwanensis J19 TaxID=935569 RepID=A0A562E612_9GAMM|nr:MULTISPECIES: flagellar type III secretion system protein FlhB [Pseudoxanthomonas]RRN81023.1 flagellar type III secretion system protein FlhB [Pseudoxanthomonas sp. SGD-10]TWH17566.1 flagellar biosynthetic protein FlhB [Pseudoxanthomonas taiwanensis J19]